MGGDATVTRKPIFLGRPPLLRQTNAEILLRLLRESGPCSKADLVRASGLSAPSVTNVVATLISIGLVETVGEGDSTGGRPPDIFDGTTTIHTGPDTPTHVLLAIVLGGA